VHFGNTLHDAIRVHTIVGQANGTVQVTNRQEKNKLKDRAKHHELEADAKVSVES